MFWSKERAARRAAQRELKAVHEKIKRDREEQARERNDVWDRRVTNIMRKLPTIIANAHSDGATFFLIHGLPQEDFEEFSTGGKPDEKYSTYTVIVEKSLSGQLRRELNNLGFQVKINSNNGFEEYCLEVTF